MISLHNLAEFDWQTHLKQAVTRLDTLLEAVELTANDVDISEEAARSFALKVPLTYLARIKKGDPNDPLLLQVLPQKAEMKSFPGYSHDPLAEMVSNPAPGLIHKYQGRVLFIVSGVCAINCRYCFRRHFPYEDQQLSGDQWQQVLTYLRNDPSISEVIFSGGDPLATSDNRLDRMISDLEAIPHLERLRIHTRLPVVIPQRVTDQLAQRLAQSRFKTVCVLHINHPNEIDDAVGQATLKLRDARVTVLNQAVLLKNINDNAAILHQLSLRLFDYAILPYYLFLLDKVEGAAHFDIDDEAAASLVRQLQATLPGYLVPRLAREVPGKPSKTWIAF